MSVLSGDTIKKMILEKGLVKDIGLVPIDKKTSKMVIDNTKSDDYVMAPYINTVLKNVGPNSLDVRIGDDFREIKASKTGYIDLSSTPEYTPMEPDEDGAFYIQPGQFCLASIVEYLQMPNNVMGMIDSRSSIGRRGLITQTATNIQAGFNGNLTLELKNEAPVAIKIFPGDVVSQIVFFYLDIETSEPYSGVYQGQKGATAPRK